MAKDTRPRSPGPKTNDLPGFTPIPPNPPPVYPKAMPFKESAHVPQTRPPSDGGGSKVSPKIPPSKGGR